MAYITDGHVVDM
jgi:hypothetical protein